MLGSSSFSRIWRANSSRNLKGFSKSLARKRKTSPNIYKLWKPKPNRILTFGWWPNRNCYSSRKQTTIDSKTSLTPIKPSAQERKTRKYPVSMCRNMESSHKEKPQTHPYGMSNKRQVYLSPIASSCKIGIIQTTLASKTLTSTSKDASTMWLSRTTTSFEARTT